MSIASRGKLIVAAIASRPYVKAAVEAGFDVVAIDAFADVDVQKLATHCYQVDLSEGQLDPNQVLSVLDDLDLQQNLNQGLQQFVGFCYGAGFEKSPNILTLINKRVTVLGNSAQVVKSCKAPDVFFGLCKQLQLPFPCIMHERPLDSRGWLQKAIGGSGGEHIKQLFDAQDDLLEDVYYQQVQPGMAVSCLFVASESSVEVVGFSELWVDINDDAPFRYGGAVSHVDLSEQAKERFTSYVVKLSQAMGLIGINSCDAIYHDNEVYLLEVNPRLSATMDLYDNGFYSGGLLMEKHIAASQDKVCENIMSSSDFGQTSKAHQVVYASRLLTVSEDIIWPEWVCDIPTPGDSFSQSMPICTVIAEAETASLAKVMVIDRALTLKKELLN